MLRQTFSGKFPTSQTEKRSQKMSASPEKPGWAKLQPNASGRHPLRLPNGVSITKDSTAQARAFSRGNRVTVVSCALIRQKCRSPISYCEEIGPGYLSAGTQTQCPRRILSHRAAWRGSPGNLCRSIASGVAIAWAGWTRVDPWIGLGWIGSRFFSFFCGLYWVKSRPTKNVQRLCIYCTVRRDLRCTKQLNLILRPI